MTGHFVWPMDHIQAVNSSDTLHFNNLVQSFSCQSVENNYIKVYLQIFAIQTEVAETKIHTN